MFFFAFGRVKTFSRFATNSVRACLREVRLFVVVYLVTILGMYTGPIFNLIDIVSLRKFDTLVIGCVYALQ